MFSPLSRFAPAGMTAACLLSIALSAATFAQSSLREPPPAPLKVLILSGGDSHNWRETTAELRKILDHSARFDVRICESPVGLTGQTLAGFDVIVDNYAGPPLGSDADKAIESFVQSGKGIVVTHGALCSSSHAHTEDARKETSGAGSRRTVPRYWPAAPPSDPEGHVQFVQVKITKTEHPIVRGLTQGFRTADTRPRGTLVLPEAEVIATARGDASAETKDEPALIAAACGKGRVALMALGHDSAAMHEKEFMAMFARATEWAATGKVTLPANLEFGRPRADAAKGLLITGGHDHEAAFYTLFDGYDDLAWLPVDTSASAFKSSLKNKYDVVIMYDFSRDLDDNGKKNLREYVENGGGVVVLHHALLNYQKWAWWSEEVVGGRYRLDRDGATPSSSVKNDQQIFVTPSGDHPVTGAIGPFHIVDEAYKNLWMSPRIRPLLTTDNPTSDTNLAWLGPEERFRVVAIQLGHGHSAFGHPSYRALVHDAVLWAARKTK
jgi:type 1 glutamine amidotransferase